MTKKSQIFETNYQEYCQKIGKCNLGKLSATLGIEMDENEAVIPFINRIYRVSENGIRDNDGKRPAYGLCVILAKYVLLCPDKVYHDPQWAAFRDFKKDAAITNVNFFNSDTEQALTDGFQDKIGILEQACLRLGGCPDVTITGYDLSMCFDILPRIRALLLFNDRDEEFSAQCRVLFQKHAEFYLDPESLAMAGAGLAKQLIKAGKEK